MVLLVLIVVGSLTISFICSVLEATLLSSRDADLIQRTNQGDQGAAVLLDIRRTQIDDAISAILTLNTIAHTIGAALSGAQAAEVFGDQWVGVFSGVLTVLILVITEIIPKTLGTVYASQLSGAVGRFLRILVVLMKPLLFITRALTRLVSHGEKSPVSRGELLAMVQIAAEEGTLEDSEMQAVSNLLRFDDIPVTSIMTPRTVLALTQMDTPVAEVVTNKNLSIFSRIPLYEQNRDQITGYVLMRDLLQINVIGSEEEKKTTARDHMRPLRLLPETTSVGKAMSLLLEHKEHLAIIIDEHGGVSGLVTLEDLVETILGVEIMDEADHVADLRQLAISMRDKRLARMEALRKSLKMSSN